MLTNKIMRELVVECEQDLQEVGLSMPRVSYQISTRLTRALGKCSWRGSNITITLSDILPREVARNTLMHEMLHAIAGPREGHTGLWLRYANLVSRNPKYNITRLANINDNHELKQAIEKKTLQRGGATVQCTTCGRQSHVTSRHGILKNVHRYSCKCGGKLLVKRD